MKVSVVRRLSAMVLAVSTESKLSNVKEASVDNVRFGKTSDASYEVPAINALASRLRAIFNSLKCNFLIKRAWAAAVLLLWTSQAYSEYYYFWLEQRPEPRFESGQAACDQYMVEYPFLVANFIPQYFWGGDYREGQLAGGFCDLHRKSDGGGLGIEGVNFAGNECPNNGILNIVAAACESSPDRPVKKALASAVNPSSCAPSSLVGNPMTVSDGLKVERNRISYTGLDLYYNSVDGRWLVDFSQRLLISNFVVILMRPDGGQILFYKKGNSYLVDEGQVGSLTRSDKWIYSSPTERMVFNAQGALEEYKAVEGETYTLTYSSDVVSISSNSGEAYKVTNASQRPISIKSKEAEVSFEYDTAGRLTKLVGSQSGQTEQRIYHYEDPRDPKLLTGITDERGVRYATWSYDDQGRAVSSEHTGGAEKVALAYNDDGSTTVTNALGKQTTYRFQVIQGVKRITAIEGEPTADCPAANSTYTYNDRGQVLTATDAEGRVTRYAYNDRGLEISRIEGEGTAEARTVTTEWDPELYRRTQVTADGRRTLYSYDDQGRLLSERTEAVSAN